ncbi:MAG: hypothetical protein LBM98_09170 [Oscillospiraceae bacterium]|nr:hypothetical protein [Oscillospiraceae bacterium]
MDAPAHGAGEGGFETRPYVTPVQTHSPLGRGAARRRRGGSRAVRGVTTSKPCKAPLFRGGEAPAGAGGVPAGRNPVQTPVIIHYSLSIINCHTVSDI